MIPRNEKSLTQLFNKFAGREVSVREEHHTIDIDGKAWPIDEVHPDPNDKTLAEMKKVADDNGLRLRVWFPNSRGTMDFRYNRMNAHVEKGADGKYRVSKHFSIG